MHALTRFTVRLPSLTLTLSLGFAPLHAANFSQERINSAVAANPPALTNKKDLELQNLPMPEAKALFFLALVAHHDPEARSTANQKLVRVRLVEHLNHITTGGKEPNANGGLSGWTHGSIACALVLAKNTPSVWSTLGEDTRERLDWLMRAMAIAGHFSFDDDNQYLTDLGFWGNFNKRSNPNYREGYMAVIIAASLYFGADELNEIFNDFDFDTYLAKFTEFGFSNIIARWTLDSRLKGVLEDGGPTGPLPARNNTSGGTGAGVRNPFTYRGVGLDDPFGLFKKLADYMYGSDDTASTAVYPVSPLVTDGLTINGVVKSYTNSSVPSPHIGEPGMALELRAYQGSAQNPSPRTSLKYAADGWNNSVSTRAMLEALGHWQGPGGEAVALRDDVEARMRVGSDDLIFKNVNGFVGWSGSGGGKQNDEIKESFTDPKVNLHNTGYLYNKEIWLNYLKALPGGFKSADIGAVGKRGRTAYDSTTGAYSIFATGAAIGGPADAFRFAFQTVDSDGRLIARIDSTDENGAAGLMFRETLDADARSVQLLRSAAGGIRLSHRATPGGVAASSESVAFPNGPVWLRLTRAGHTFTGHASADGETWTPVGEAVVVEAPALLHGGLAHSAGDDATLASAEFSRVSIESIPPGWETRDIGSVAAAGHARVSDGVFSLVGSGANIWGAADSFRFLYRPLPGDGQITARVISVERTHPDAKGGLMIRSTLDADSPHAMVNLRNGKGVNLVRRTIAGDASTSNAPLNVNVPYWLRLVRTGSSVAAHHSPDGANWTLIDTVTLPGETVYVGLGYCSLGDGHLGRATFDHVRVDPQPGPSPAPVALTGTIISSPAASGRGPDRAFDGDLLSTFGAASSHSGWVGLDLGEQRRIVEVRYAPRGGQAGRMRGSVIHGANRADFVDATIIGYITETPPTGELTSLPITAPGTYRYVRYYGAFNTYSDVAELAFYTRADLREWRRATFGDAENLGLAADTADPDGDGIPNLLEYAFGGDPLVPGTATLPTADILADRLALAFDRVADPALTYAVQATDSLEGSASWTDIWTSTGASNFAGPAAVPDETRFDNAPRRFLRVEVRR